MAIDSEKASGHLKILISLNDCHTWLSMSFEPKHLLLFIVIPHYLSIPLLSAACPSPTSSSLPSPLSRLL